MESSLKFYIAGTIQGSRTGTMGMGQDYRETLRRTIIARYSDAAVICPLALLMERFTGRMDHAMRVYQQETAEANLDARQYGSVVSEIRSAFIELTELAGTADVLVAHLPAQEASMGTAMEMWSAFSRGRTVIAITPMTQNLSIVSISDIILPSMEAFKAFIAGHRLTELLAGKTRGIASGRKME